MAEYRQIISVTLLDKFPALFVTPHTSSNLPDFELSDFSSLLFTHSNFNSLSPVDMITTLTL